MRQLENSVQRSDIERIADFGFFIFLLTSYAFNHTIIGQLGLIIFLGTIYLLVIASKKIFFSYYFFFSIAFIIYNCMLNQMGISIDVQTSGKMINTLIINCLFSFALFNYLVIKKDMRHALKLFMFASLLFTFVIVTLSSSIIFQSRLGTSINIMGVSVDYNANDISRIFAFSYLIALYEFLSSKNKLFLISIIWFLLLVILTGSRTGLLIAILGSGLLMFFLYPTKRTRNILLFLILFGILYVAVMYIPWLYNIAGSRLEVLMNVILGKEVEEASLLSRLGYIKLGWIYFLEKPWTGYGLDCFRLLHNAYETYSHNNYIELLFSGGIIGFSLYYFPIIVIIIKFIMLMRKISNIAKMAFALFLAQVALEYASVTYFERIPIVILIFTLAAQRLYEIKKDVLRRERPDGNLELKHNS